MHFQYKRSADYEVDHVTALTNAHCKAKAKNQESA